VLQDKAMSVLKRSSSSAYEDVPGEAVAAAASVVARLTEVHSGLDFEISINRIIHGHFTTFITD
jgi:hypothetical protein